MGTRADFYAGRDETAEWLGSIAWDGDSLDDEGAIEGAKDEASYRAAVAAFLATREDATTPDLGWPWPWDDSGTSDCSYWFFGGALHQETQDHYTLRNDPATPEWGKVEDEDAAYAAWLKDKPAIKHPNMKHIQNVDLGKRSGIMIFAG